MLEATVSICASETVKDLIKFNDCSATHVAKQVSISGVRDAEQMKRLLGAASILRKDKEKMRVANFVYNTKNNYFAKVGYLLAGATVTLFVSRVGKGSGAENQMPQKRRCQGTQTQRGQRHGHDPGTAGPCQVG